MGACAGWTTMAAIWTAAVRERRARGMKVVVANAHWRRRPRRPLGRRQRRAAAERRSPSVRRDVAHPAAASVAGAVGHEPSVRAPPPPALRAWHAARLRPPDTPLGAPPGENFGTLEPEWTGRPSTPRANSSTATSSEPRRSTSSRCCRSTGVGCWSRRIGRFHTRLSRDPGPSGLAAGPRGSALEGPPPGVPAYDPRI